MSLICKIFGHSMYSDTDNIAGPASCKRCSHTEKAIQWPRSNDDTTKYRKEDGDLKNMGDDKEKIAVAEAQDYENLIPTEKPCKYNIICHIAAALLLSAFVVGLFTLGIMFLS